MLRVNRTFIEIETKNPWDALKNASFPKIDQLASMTGTHIHVKRSQNSAEEAILVFWGNNDQVAKAKAEVNQWIAELGGKSQKAATWAKVWSLTPALKESLQQKLEHDERRQTFRQHPDENAKFLAQVSSFSQRVCEIRANVILGTFPLAGGRI